MSIHDILAEAFLDDWERPECPLCGTLVDEHGYCVDPGCRNCGKVPQ